jgi:hypothetical protein
MKNNLEDIKVNVKIKVSALWASVTLCYIYGDYFELYIPKKVEGLISGDNVLASPTKLFLASLFLAIPALMVCLSIILKPTINKCYYVIDSNNFSYALANILCVFSNSRKYNHIINCLVCVAMA